MRVTLIHNPGAGAGGLDEAGLKARIRDAGHEVDIPSDAAARERALDAPGDLVAVAGGDGTLGRIAKRMAGRDVPIAPLPTGTANNISRTLGAKDVSIEQLVETWSEARRLRFDLGAAHGPWGSRRFIEGVGIGLFAWMMPRADASDGLSLLDDAGDKLVYALQMLKDRLQRLSPVRVEAMLDGRDISGEYLLVEAMNIPFVGPNLYLAPRGDPADGLLDVALVTEADRKELFSCLAGWQRGQPCRPDLPTHCGRELRIRWDGFPVHIDDEVWPEEGGGAAPDPAAQEIVVTIGEENVVFLEPGLPVGS